MAFMNWKYEEGTFDRGFVNVARRLRREAWLVRLIDLMLPSSHGDNWLHSAAAAFTAMLCELQICKTLFWRPTKLN